MPISVVVVVTCAAAPPGAASRAKIARINIALRGARPSNGKLNGITPCVVVTRVKLLIGLGITFPPEGFIHHTKTFTDVDIGRRKGGGAPRPCGVELSE